MTLYRRHFLKQSGLLTASALLAPAIKAMAVQSNGKKQKLLVRSSWQTINIGDIGHSFGLIALLQAHLPDAEIILWPNLLDRGVDVLMKKTFPTVTILPSETTVDGKRIPELQKAFDECTMMIHSSGPYVTAQKNLQDWWAETKKPFGIYGVSLDEAKPELKELINHASFFYCRDTESLRYLKSLNLKCPVQEFGPDATFGITVHDDAKAEAYLAATGLKKGEYICVIPRLRYTPNWKIKGLQPKPIDKWKDQVSELHKEKDAEKLREVITRWVKETGLKVLVCPEVTYQVEFSKETLVDPLPAEIKKNVVWRDSFWLPDEAASVYARSRMMVGVEPHSPIIAVANGIPSIHIKQPSDTRKGQMWRDIGLGDWYFLIDETPASQIADTIMWIHNNYAAALTITNNAKDKVAGLQRRHLKLIK